MPFTLDARRDDRALVALSLAQRAVRARRDGQRLARTGAGARGRWSCASAAERLRAAQSFDPAPALLADRRDEHAKQRAGRGDVASVGRFDRRSRASARLRASARSRRRSSRSRKPRRKRVSWSVARATANASRCSCRQRSGRYTLSVLDISDDGSVSAALVDDRGALGARHALMLLDTYGLVYRAFFALPGLTTSKGVPINAVYGFTMMLNKTHRRREADARASRRSTKGMPADRVALYPEYKAQRDAMPDDLRSQFALVRRMLGALSAFRSSRWKGKKPTTSSRRSRAKPKRRANRRSS